ncbi:MAG: hypothetical protein H6718_29535 [Polyangiaceae bacterium]|nr:hypothetical protein [Polyangiaceae bacterium]
MTELEVLACPRCGADASGAGTCKFCGATLVLKGSVETPDAWVARAVEAHATGRGNGAERLLVDVGGLTYAEANRFVRDGRLPSLQEDWIHAARRDLDAGKPVKALKALRQHLHLGMADAKQLIDSGALNAADFVTRARALVLKSAKEAPED